MNFSPLRLTAPLLAAVAFTTPARAQKRQDPVEAGTAAAIRRLLELTGTAQLAMRGVEAMVPAQRAANPQVPGVFWDAFLVRARRQIPQYMDSLVPIYTAHLTRAELDQLVKFYESPLGRRVAEVTPLITQESMELGQRWGAAIGREIGDSLAQASAEQQDPQED